MNKKEILILSICVFLTVIAWLVADLYRASNESKIKMKIELPLIENYEIKKEILEILKNKIE